jgi:signal transduction histidine kinase
LIQAQEQERTRIARELHDDINQRIAMLAIDLSNLSSGLPADVESRLEKVQQRILDIGKEVQAISHRLHSSKLEYLGLVPACRGFCRELAERHTVTIDFNAEGVPRELPPDISLTLLRVMQESLQNAIKHSGSKEFNVQLRGLSTEIHLAVRDRGTGFDANAALHGHGLGLISMRERVNSLNGTIFIASKAMSGTEINVRVPLAAAAVETNSVALGAA